MNKCKRCGADVPDGANFCNICGNSIEGEDSKENFVNLQKDSGKNASSVSEETSQQSSGKEPDYNSQQYQNNQHFNNGQQYQNSQQFNNGQQYQNNQQFNNGQQYQNNQQFSNGQQFQQKETASVYYGKQPYIPSADNVQANKGISICAYLGILWIIPLITVKNSPFTRFHTNQAILVFITNVIINIAFGVFNFILQTISWRFYVVSGFFSIIAWGLSIALMVIGIVYAAQGKMKEIPVLGQFHILK